MSWTRGASSQVSIVPRSTTRRRCAAIWQSRKNDAQPRRTSMAWQNDSIMARKGVARGERGKQYTITEAEQGKYHYVYGPYVGPVLTVDPGAVVAAETH